MNTKPNSTSFKVGHKPLSGAFGKGSSHSEQSRKLISQSLYGKKGKLSRRWKGDLAGYTALHVWVKKQKGKPTKCENSNCLGLPAGRYEWASLSGECKRDLEDFVSLCTRCHRRYDNGNLEISINGEKFTREKFIICEKCNHKNLL